MKKEIKTLEKELEFLEKNKLLEDDASKSIRICANILPYLDNPEFDKYYKRFKKMQQKYK